MKKGVICAFWVFLLGCIACNTNKPQPQEWDGLAYTHYPQLVFGKTTSPDAIIQEEKKIGGALESNTIVSQEASLRALIFNNYSIQGLSKRAYYLQNDRLTEVIQLVEPLSLVIEYKDAQSEPKLNPLFERWAKHEGFNIIKYRVKDFLLLNESAKLQLIVVPAQFAGNSRIFAEMHYLPVA